MSQLENINEASDFEQDEKIGKNTLCVRAGNRENSVNLISGIIIFAFVLLLAYANFV